MGIYLTIYTDVPCDLGLGFLLVARGVYMNIYSALGSAGTSFLLHMLVPCVNIINKKLHLKL